MGPKKGISGRGGKSGGGPGKKSSSSPPEKPRKTHKSDHTKRQQQQQQQQQGRTDSTALPQQQERIDFDTVAASIPLPLQQLLLNVFRCALLHDERTSESSEAPDAAPPDDGAGSTASLHDQIQTMKAHLYQRDFASAFADASPDLLRAYALRWSASRCLGYVGLLRGMISMILGDDAEEGMASRNGEVVSPLHVLCVGGGAGAEIVALAGVWRLLQDEVGSSSADWNTATALLDKDVHGIESGVGNFSLGDEQEDKHGDDAGHQQELPKLSVTAVDIADWSSVVSRLRDMMYSASVTGSRSHPSPLLSQDDRGKIEISFRHLDILSLLYDDLNALLAHKGQGTSLITLMFTLNELFTTSIAKTTQFLLRLTDLTAPGAVLLVVDSPGSYSTLSLGSDISEQKKQRQYPMKFLLDHTLLSVADGKWERIVSQDSRWWRRDASRLRYDVNLEGGEGLVKLEDMRFQIHVYRRL
jgi:25S rRNA (uracil2843-N3)-methyltransferase